MHIEKLRSAYFANFQFSTSSKVGTEGAAPGLDTAIADALDARSNASFGLSPLLIADTQRTNLIDGVNVGLLICYENLFGDVLRQYWATGTPPDIIAVTANLGWFGLEANAQHLQISRLRALEVARAIVSVSNNGLSAVVDTQGKILSTLPINTADVDVVAVPKCKAKK